MWLADISPPFPFKASESKWLVTARRCRSSVKLGSLSNRNFVQACRAEYQRAHRIDQIFPNRPAAQQIGSH